MKKLLTGFILICICLIFSTEGSSAQNNQDSTKYQIETADGNEYVGLILDRSSDRIKLKTEKLGEISILKTDIKKITEITKVVGKDGNFWFDNPQSTRYFWAPNGYNLKKGEGYYQNVWILFNQAAIGITDHFSAGVGTLPLFLFGGAPTPAWLTAKFSVPVVENKINLGVGALMGTVLGTSRTGFGILYGISTFGSKDKNLNVGLGWAYAGGKIASSPTVNISGMIRTGQKGYFITENYFIGTPDNFSVLMIVGGRRIIKHVGLDFGAVIPLGDGINSLIAVPWLGLTIPFGTKSPAMK